jgi:hypothetical protein
MSDISNYDKAIKRLNEFLSNLQSFTSSVESLFSTYEKLTEDCSSRLKSKVSIEAKLIQYYVKRWFRSFIGIKDECMALISGEIIRRYHQNQHKLYLHDRGNENKIYKRSETLSACSVDGIDYEYRKYSKKYGNKLVRYQNIISFDNFVLNFSLYFFPLNNRHYVKLRM